MTERKSIQLIIEKAEEGTRLDKFISGELGISRSQYERVVNTVSVNGLEAPPNTKLKAGDTVNVSYTEINQDLLFDPVAEKIDLEIVHEEDDLVFINKPAGLTVHPGAGIKTGTLYNALIYRYPDLSKKEFSFNGERVSFSSEAFRMGIVHRLDKGTSGVMVIAKTPQMAEELKSIFHSHLVVKEYVAIVHGEVERDWMRIDKPICRSEKDRTRYMVCEDGSGREAISEVRVIRRYSPQGISDSYSGGPLATKCQVNIFTGRTHQIRVHMLSVGHPVVGDPIYLPPQKRMPFDKNGLGLASVRLAFELGDGRRFDIKVPEPERFLEIENSILGLVRQEE